jgi:hypothetical protein
MLHSLKAFTLAVTGRAVDRRDQLLGGNRSAPARAPDQIQHPQGRTDRGSITISPRTVAPPLSASDQDAIHEAIEERAAILEFEAGRSRTEAETQAALSLHVYRYRVTDRPQDWLTLIAPGCDLEEARQSLLWQFGPDRLIEVRPQTIPHH